MIPEKCQFDIAAITTNIAIILERVKVLPEMAKKIEDIDKNQSRLCTKVTRNEQDIKDLEKKSDNWSMTNSIVSAVTAIIAGITGLLGFGQK